MATYLWSTLVNGRVINPFNPSVDILRFDSPTVSAAAVDVLGGAASTQLSYLGKSVTLQMPLFSTTTSNVRFDNGSLLLVGDNAAGTAADNTAHTLTGGAGNDQLIAGAGGYTLNGGGGNDKLTGGSGNDTLNGGTGVDTMAGGAGNDTYFVDSTSDVITEAAGQGTDRVFSSVDYTLSANVDNLELTGTAGLSGTGNAIANLIVGNSAGNALNGAAGNDILQGAGGSDNLTGGAGADRLDGGAGFDNAMYDMAAAAVVVNLQTSSQNTGEAAGDTYISIEGVIGSRFNDTLTGDDNGNDVIGMDGNDTLFGLNGDDDLEGGNGNDQLFGGEGGDILDGGAGIDTARYDNGSVVTADLANAASNAGDAAGDTYVAIENITGSQWDDVLSGNSSNNALTGGSGDDQLFGRAGNDALLGQAGDDLLDGGAGADSLDGGMGLDFATYENATGGVRASLVGGVQSGDASGDTFVSVEGLLGSKFADTLIGDANANDIQGLNGDDVLIASGGDDTISAGNGDDSLFGGLGADVLSGGAGFDFARYDLASSGVVVDLSSDHPSSGEAAGDDIFGVEGVVGSIFDDELYGDADANDLRAVDGNDFVHGNAGNDSLVGGTGNDTLDGGVGADRLEGGSGSDIFILSRSEADGDVIADFDRAADHLQLIGYGSPADGATFIQLDSTHWSINSDDGAVHDIITIANAVPLTAADYTFI
jgi:Ca2+-binding RTX toxin-like protein